jgi:hypothetical protein
MERDEEEKGCVRTWNYQHDVLSPYVIYQVFAHGRV